MGFVLPSRTPNGITVINGEAQQRSAGQLSARGEKWARSLELPCCCDCWCCCWCCCWYCCLCCCSCCCHFWQVQHDVQSVFTALSFSLSPFLSPSPFLSLCLIGFASGLSDTITVASFFGCPSGCSPDHAPSSGAAHAGSVVNPDPRCLVHHVVCLFGTSSPSCTEFLFSSSLVTSKHSTRVLPLSLFLALRSRALLAFYSILLPRAAHPPNSSLSLRIPQDPNWPGNVGHRPHVWRHTDPLLIIDISPLIVLLHVFFLVLLLLLLLSFFTPASARLLTLSNSHFYTLSLRPLPFLQLP